MRVALADLQSTLVIWEGLLSAPQKEDSVSNTEQVEATVAVGFVSPHDVVVDQSRNQKLLLMFGGEKKGRPVKKQKVCDAGLTA